jgi:Asp/Glu/hydantoin racemase
MNEAQLMAAAASDPQAVLKSFTKAARHAIAHSGAEVIVPAEAVLATLIIANQLKEIDGAPVVDCLAIAWRYTLMMIRLRNDCGLQVSRIGSYARSDPALIALMAR